MRADGLCCIPLCHGILTASWAFYPLIKGVSDALDLSVTVMLLFFWLVILYAEKPCVPDGVLGRIW